MGVVVAVKWRIRKGEEERAFAAIRKMIEPSRNEPGNRQYQPCRDPDDPCVFFFFEEYEDEAAMEAHRASEHAQQYVFGECFPLLEDREIAIYRTIDA